MAQPTYSVSSELQAEHYDRIAQDYALHYGDKYSSAYRDRFINKHLFAGLDLAGKSVLEAMCGSGETTRYMLSKSARVIGLDVSAAEIEKFQKRWPEAEGVCSSIFETEFDDATLDFVVVVGGLHHLHPHLSDAVREMHRILKPGGYLVFAEPHKGSFLDSIRQFWYRRDDLFAANEEAIDVQSMKAEFGELFDQAPEKYCGNIGYLLVLNSMVFRLPLALKRVYSPILLGIERMIEPLQRQQTSCMVIGQWRKK